MKTLRHQIAEVAKHKRVPATLLETAGGVCTVRLGNNGRVLHGVPYSGGRGSPGDSVHVDYSSGSPIVLAQGQLYTPEPQPKKIVPRPPASEEVPPQGDMIQRFVDGTLAAVYEPSEDGMNEALAESAGGHLILLPVIELTLDFTVPQGVIVAGDSRFTSTIHGTVTLSKTTTLDKLCVIDSESSDAEATAVIATASAAIHDCNIWACNCGTGAATGAKVTGGKLSISNASLSGESEGVAGYGVIVESGSAEVRDTSVFGSTAQWPEDDQIYVYGTVTGSAYCVCEPGDTYMGSAYLDGTGVLYQIIQPFERGVTLGEDATLDQKAVYQPNEGTYVNGIAVSANNLFYLSNIGNHFSRRALTEDGADKYVVVDPDISGEGEDVFDPAMCVVNDNTVYVAYVASVDSLRWDLVLAKFDLENDTRTVIETWPAESIVFNGDAFTLHRILWATRLMHGELDKLVICTDWNPEAVDHYAGRLIILDLLTDTVEYEEFFELAPKTEGPSWSQAIITSPTAYQDKIIFNATIDDYYGVDPDSICAFPAFVVDCTNKTLTRVDNLRRDYAGWWGRADGNAGVDRSAGIYYAWIGDYEYGDLPEALVKIDLNATSYSMEVVGRYANQCWIQQGKNSAYAIRLNESDRASVHSLPDMNQLGLFDAGIDPGEVVIDNEAGYAWGAKDTEVQGVPLAGGEARSLTLNFVESPYRYLDYREINRLMIFNDHALVQVYSREIGVGTQRDYFLMGA